MTALRGRVRGYEVELLAFDGRLFTLVSASAFAPGQPLELELEDVPPLSLKSLGSIKRSDGKFDVRARATTLTRPARDALRARFG